MSNGQLLRELFQSGADGDRDAFRGVAKRVIAEERQKQHHLLADDLDAILHGRPNRRPNGRPPDRANGRPPGKPPGRANGRTVAAERPLTGSVPTDRERDLPLLTVRRPERGLPDIVLSPENRAAVEEFLLEHHRSEVLQAHGLRPGDRLLLCGPPGCGKTLTAEVMAYEMNRPLAVVRADSVVSSFLGETAANLRKVFDFASASPTVTLFDEFDAIGKEREDRTEHGELRRVVNAVLQMLDTYSGNSVLIAATNHEGMLDSAIWRRFDEVLFLGPPPTAEVAEVLRMKLRGVRFSFDLEKAAARPWFRNTTHAEIERLVRRARKDRILGGSAGPLRLSMLEAARRRERARSDRSERRREGRPWR